MKTTSQYIALETARLQLEQLTADLTDALERAAGLARQHDYRPSVATADRLELALEYVARCRALVDEATAAFQLAGGTSDTLPIALEIAIDRAADCHDAIAIHSTTAEELVAAMGDAAAKVVVGSLTTYTAALVEGGVECGEIVLTTYGHTCRLSVTRYEPCDDPERVVAEVTAAVESLPALEREVIGQRVGVRVMGRYSGNIEVVYEHMTVRRTTSAYIGRLYWEAETGDAFACGDSAAAAIMSALTHHEH